MNSFPITNADYRSEFSNYFCSYCIPRFEWGKKIYLLIKEELRAVVPLAVCIAKKKGEGDKIHPYLLCRMAGYDKNMVIQLEFMYDSKPEKLACGVKAYETRDDYFSALKGNDTQMRFQFVSLDWCLQQNGYKLCSDYSSTHCAMAWGFSESNVKPIMEKTGIKGLWLDEDGPHVELTYKYAYGDSVLYPSERESLLAHTANVFDFDDEPAPAVEQEFIVNLPKQVPVTAKTAEEAEAKVAESIRNLVNQ